MTKLDDLSEAIGQLRAEVRILSDQQRAVESGRGRMYEKLDRMGRKIDATDSTVTSIDERLSKVEEPVAEFSRWRERFIGMALLITFIAGSIGAAAAWVAGKVMSLFSS